MAKSMLALVEGGPKNLCVEWRSGFKGLHVTLDGNELLRFPTKKDLETGGSAALPDGGQLSVRLISSLLFPAIEVLHNGFPVPGSQTHPLTRIQGGSTALYALGVITVVSAGIIGAQTEGADLAGVIGTLLEALLFCVFAFFTRKKMRWALIAGTGLYTLESAFSLFAIASGSAGAGAAGGIGGFIFWRVVFYTMLIRAFRAFREIDRMDPNAAVAVFR
jgi:hypothetical protein